MIKLETFGYEDFDRLISWVKSEKEMIQFAGPVFTYPLTREQLIQYSTNKVRQVFKVRLISTGEVVGHCELNFQNQIPRLSRILIGDSTLRNQGMGKAIVRSLLDRVFESTCHDSVDLTVFN
ncbi:GNAT family N-acetyltransferase [Desertivirga brevis]|uniref:GNAT family N-acetyltransferase n=1 Tax=Desertivirga brevis TaxID=2810310 RepID=UPI001A96AC59|nr:GNAT family protein [Pedobacter sp. SYSU D00873]